MGNNPSHSKYDENLDLWSLKVLVRIGVLVDPMGGQGRGWAMARVMNNSTLRKQVPDDTLLEYRKECKHVKTVPLIIPNNWQDYSNKFHNYINNVSTCLNLHWFHVALVCCENNFDKQKTIRKCQKLTHVLPQRHMAPFDNDPEANPWYFMNKSLNEFKTVPSFADHIATSKTSGAADNQ